MSNKDICYAKHDAAQRAARGCDGCKDGEDCVEETIENRLEVTSRNGPTGAHYALKDTPCWSCDGFRPDGCGKSDQFPGGCRLHSRGPGVSV